MINHKLTLDGDRIIIETERPARIVASFRFPDEGGVYAGEMISENRYRLPEQATAALRKWSADTKSGTFSVQAVYGGFAGVDIPKSQLLAVIG